MGTHMARVIDDDPLGHRKVLRPVSTILLSLKILNTRINVMSYHIYLHIIYVHMNILVQ